jgi:hypothetical protein
VVRNDLDAGAGGYGAILAAAGAGSVLTSLIVSQRGPPRRYLTPVSFALTGPVSKAIGVDATLIVAGAAPMIVCVVLYLAAGLRRDEEIHPLLPTPAVP